MASGREIPGGEPPHPLRHLASLRRGAPVAGLDAQVRQVFRRRGERPRQTGHWRKLVSGGCEWLRSWRVVLDHISAEAGLLFDRRRACRRRGLGRRGWFVPWLHPRGLGQTAEPQKKVGRCKIGRNFERGKMRAMKASVRPARDAPRPLDLERLGAQRLAPLHQRLAHGPHLGALALAQISG